MSRSLPDVLQVHSQLGAEGWQLVDRCEASEPAPARAVGLYKRGGEQAWLMRRSGGFELQAVSEPSAIVEVNG
jgi:hypothetical protein